MAGQRSPVRALAAIILATGLVGGAAALDDTLDVEARHEPGVQLGHFATLAWLPKGNTTSSAVAKRHPEYVRWMKATVEGGLKAKGYDFTEPADAELGIDFQVRSQDVDLVAVSHDIDEGQISDGGDFSAGRTRGPGAGTFVLHVVRNDGGKVVWIGKVTELLDDPEKAHARVVEGINRLLKKFPDRAP